MVGVPKASQRAGHGWRGAGMSGGCHIAARSGSSLPNAATRGQVPRPTTKRVSRHPPRQRAIEACCTPPTKKHRGKLYAGSGR